MSGERFTLDTNILVYSVAADADQRHKLAAEIMELAIAGDCWLTLQSVSEFYTVVTRKRVLARDHAAKLADAWLRVFPIASASPQAARAAMTDAVASGASYWDALLVRTAAEAGCTAILSEDMADGGTPGGLRIVNPFGATSLTPAAMTVLAAPVAPIWSSTVPR